MSTGMISISVIEWVKFVGIKYAGNSKLEPNARFFQDQIERNSTASGANDPFLTKANVRSLGDRWLGKVTAVFLFDQ